MGDAHPTGFHPVIPMQWLNDIAATYPLFQQILLIFTLVLSRVGGLLMIAPIYGTRDVPLRVRAFLAVTLAMLVTPTQLGVLVDGPEKMAALIIEPDRDVEQPIDWNTRSGDPGNLINLLVFIGTVAGIGRDHVVRRRAIGRPGDRADERHGHGQRA